MQVHRTDAASQFKIHIQMRRDSFFLASNLVISVLPGSDSIDPNIPVGVQRSELLVLLFTAHTFNSC